MSEIMLSVLRMPDDLFWNDCPITRMQHNFIRKEAADEIERLQAERDALLTEAKGLREKVRYFENTFCCQDIPVMLSTGCSTMALDPERVADLVRERDRLQQTAGKAVPDVSALEEEPINVIYTDGCGAGRRSPADCRDGVSYVTVGDTVYWPLSADDAQRLRAAECSRGDFTGPGSTSPDVDVLVGKIRRLITTGNRLSAEATEAQERTFDGDAAEVASIYFWNEFRDALKAVTKVLEAYCKQGGSDNE